jgi:hypothetical protein
MKRSLTVVGDKRVQIQIATVATFAVLIAGKSAPGIMIVPDYTYDTAGFFASATEKAGLEAAAARLSAVITSSLTAVGPAGTGTGTGPDWRIGFTHPGTGAPFQVSTAASSATDDIFMAGGPVANVYGFGGLAADTWILYAGGRSLGGSTAGVGGTSTGTNFTPGTFADLNGPMRRGVISEMSPTENDIPAWGGSVSFDNDGSTVWHYDPTTPAPLGTVDLYSIALHEIGHALGLNLSFNQFTADQTGSSYAGSESLAAYNADNGASETSLGLVSAVNRHWDEDTYNSFIFPAGGPNYVGTLGPLIMQDLLMEPEADFSLLVRRLELTNVDVAQLRDLGWSTVAVPEASAFLCCGLICGAFAIGYARKALAAKGKEQGVVQVET